MKTNKEFPNGFENWIETHHVVVQEIHSREGKGGQVDLIAETEGTGGLWALGEQLTDEFEELNEGVVWGEEGREFFFELWEFLSSKNL